MVLNKKLALEILNVLLSTGADYAEIYFQDCRTHDYSRRYRKVHSVSSGRVCGIGLRILRGSKTIYGYTSDFSRKSLVALATNLASGWTGERVATVEDLVEEKVERRNPIAVLHDEWTTAEKLSYLEKGEKAAFAYSPLVKDVSTALSESDETVEIYNSEGKVFSDSRVRTRLFVVVTASDGTSFQTGFAGPGLSCGLELLERTDVEGLARKTAKVACDLLTAEDAPSGEMPVVLGNAFGGVLFHEACGHPLEGSSISTKTSPFCGKLGQRIASPIVNAFDDGTIANGWGTEGIDDEGQRPTKNQLIKDGILVSYMVDRQTGRKMGMKPTGSCRRENYRYLPTTRMTNTYIGNGTSTREEIIASVQDGIYCEDFTGGQVDPSTDQFIFTSTTAYRIRDGKVTNMVKPVSLMGYGYEILNRIAMVGNDLERAAGTCGASSGSCFVEVGQPTLLISKILVGGEGGQK